MVYICLPSPCYTDGNSFRFFFFFLHPPSPHSLKPPPSQPPPLSFALFISLFTLFFCWDSWVKEDVCWRSEMCQRCFSLYFDPPRPTRRPDPSARTPPPPPQCKLAAACLTTLIGTFWQSIGCRWQAPHAGAGWRGLLHFNLRHQGVNFSSPTPPPFTQDSGACRRGRRNHRRGFPAIPNAENSAHYGERRNTQKQLVARLEKYYLYISIIIYLPANI